MKRRLPLLLLTLAAVGCIFYWVVLRPNAATEHRSRERLAKRGAGATQKRRPSDRRARLKSSETPAAIATESPTSAGKRLVDGRWGAGPGQFGRLKARESNPEGPMAIASAGKGVLLVLDQVNSRMQRFDAQGQLLSTQKLPTNTAQDITVDPRGNTLVLDRLGQDPKIHIFDASGNPKGTVPFSEEVGDPGGVSGVFADEDGIYVEVGHDKVHRIADAQGNPVSTHDDVPGRPTRDGRLFIKAGLLDKSAGRVYVQAHDKTKKLAWESALNLGGAVVHILLLDSDKAGNVYLGAEVEESPGPPAIYKTVIARLEGQKGKLTGQLILPPTTGEPSETFRPLTVDDHGTIYQLVHGASGPTLTSYSF